MNERGAVSVVAVSVVSLIIFTGVVGLSVGRVIIGAHQVQLAADAAALAAARATFTDRDPAAAARTLARANGADLETCFCPADTTNAVRVAKVMVSMSVDAGLIGVRRVRAAAAAEFDPAGG